MERHQVSPGVLDFDGLTDLEGAAKYLHTTPRHVRALWSQRRLTAVRVGRLVRFQRSDLDAFITAHRVEAVRQ
jgi:excisionase family DNA binding protein